MPTAEPVSLRYPLRDSLTAPIRPSHRPQGHKRSRMLAREPNASLRASLSQRLDVLIQLHFPILCWVAGLKCRIRAKACKLVILPVRGKDLACFAIGRRG